MKNKKGFTLVELLAVIVILALIMSIAVVSIGGVLQSTRQSTFKETAAGIIDGVQKHLLVTNELQAGYYTFTDAIVEKGGKESPLGGEIIFSGGTGTQIGTSPVYRSTAASMSCTANGTSYVHVTYDATTYKYTYTICLTTKLKSDGTSKNYYITDADNKSEYSRLTNNSLVDMITNE